MKLLTAFFGNNRRVIVGVVTVVMILAGTLVYKMNELGRNDRAYGLLGAIGAFCRLHQRLPNDWKEYVDWHNKADTSNPWTTEPLEKRFKLKWGAYLRDIKVSDQIFIVIDPSFKAHEVEYNTYLIRCLLSLAQTNVAEKFMLCEPANTEVIFRPHLGVIMR